MRKFGYCKSERGGPNHANWYVVRVLGVTEGYRRLASDDTAGPYV
jgi:hypothetical protein